MPAGSVPPALSTQVPFTAEGLQQYVKQVPCAFGCRSSSTGTPRNVAPPPCWCMITLSPVGAIKLMMRSPMKLCSISMQIDCRSFAEVTVCPGANCVKVTVLVKHSPTLSGRKTPPPAFGFGSSFHVVPCTTPFKQSVSPAQPSAFHRYR